MVGLNSFFLLSKFHSVADTFFTNYILNLEMTIWKHRQKTSIVLILDLIVRMSIEMVSLSHWQSDPVKPNFWK